MNQEVIDIRLVNICNNACLYCLESSLRKKYPLLQLNFEKLSWKSISIYGGNIFAYHDIIDVLEEIKSKWVKIISIQTNWYGLSMDILNRLKDLGVTTINFKFHSLDLQKDYLLAWRPKRYISVKKKLYFLRQMVNMWFIVRINYFITKLNLIDLYKDFLVLYKLEIKDFDYIWPHPFDKVRDFKDLVLIDYENVELKKYFNSFLRNLKKIILINSNLKVFFKKMPFSFFENDNLLFFNWDKTIYSQISKEDMDILDWKVEPYCYPYRCKYCFLKDICSIRNGKLAI